MLKQNEANYKYLIELKLQCILAINQCLGRRKSSQNDDIGLEETKDLIRDRANASNKEEKQPESLKQARKNLDQKNMVVITGVQGSGKTF